jgi:hypothetical protein
MINKTGTSRVAVTGVGSQVVSAEARVRIFRLFADRVVHVLVYGGPTVATATNALPMAAFTAEVFSVPANANLSVVLADGEPSGNLWITEQ